MFLRAALKFALLSCREPIAIAETAGPGERPALPVRTVVVPHREIVTAAAFAHGELANV